VLWSSWLYEELYAFGKGDLSSGVQGVDFGCTKSKDKGKSQTDGLGTGCRSRGLNQDKSLVFAFVIFSVIYFPLLQVLYI